MKQAHKVAFASGSAAALVSGYAAAALPTGVATGFTSISTNLQDVFDLAMPVVILGVVLTLIIKLMKKFANKV